MRHGNILVLGGSGMIGRHLVARLVALGRHVTVLSRQRERARPLILLPTVDVVSGDPYDEATLERLLVGQDALVNLVGVLHSTPGSPYGPEFARAHVELPRLAARACARTGVRRVLHVSALRAGSDAPSMYLRSKAAGEDAWHAQSGLEVSIFRPATLFGPEDHFLNLFGALQRWLPVILLPGAESRYQPVGVVDVARAMANALDAPEAVGRTYELAGPVIYTLREIVQIAGLAGGHRRPIIALPAGLSRLQVRLMQWMPGPTLISPDNLDSMRLDSIATGAFPGIEAPELTDDAPWRLATLEQAALEQLGGIDPKAHLYAYRARAHR